MEVILPQLGLFFWTTVLFLVFFFILRGVAWKPIMNALKEREENIATSLAEAVTGREEMEKLTADNQALLREAKVEREKILKEAKAQGDQLVSLARKEAADAGAKEREKAKQQIETEKNAALAEIKSTAAALAIEVAEKILRREFQNKENQEAYAEKLIADLNNN
ncbi:MAG: F0F1 ATP synthase subunit B [Leptospiraceae bacterium]|nr:F0F1 ATP synthase subunit B [Leptospiraceae bacterium]